MRSSVTSKLSTSIRFPDWGAWSGGDTTGNDGVGYIAGLCAPKTYTTPGEWFTVENTAEMIIRDVFGTVCAETDIIRSDENIFVDYADSALTRLKSNVDTGMLHDDTPHMWAALSDEEKSDAEKLVRSSAEKLIDFPDVSAMNIVDTNVPVTIDVRFADVPAIIPALVETATGTAAVIPSVRGYWYADSAFCCLSYPYSEDVQHVHVWDIPRMKITKASSDLFVAEGDKIAGSMIR